MVYVWSYFIGYYKSYTNRKIGMELKMSIILYIYFSLIIPTILLIFLIYRILNYDRLPRD
jgi:hypothetical protein